MLKDYQGKKLTFIGMIKIVKYQTKFYKSVSQLIDSNFGVGYCSSKKIEVNFSWCAINENNEIVGFSSLLVEKQEVIFDLIVVEKKSRGKNIAKDLFAVRFAKAKQLRLKKIIINHWVKKEALKPFYAESLGFKFTKRSINYWAEESTLLKYHCLECDKFPCRCVCDTYTLILIN